MKNLALSAYCKSKAALITFTKREEGATAIEYALIAGLIAVVIIGATGLLGDSISDTFSSITEAIEKAAEKGKTTPGAESS